MGSNDLPFYMADESKDEVPPAFSVCLFGGGEGRMSSWVSLK